MKRCYVLHAIVPLGLVLLRAPAAAQPPVPGQPGRGGPPQTDAPMNLQALPKEMSRPELIAAMQAFTQALGVRCEYCHTGPASNLDYSSDEKPAKRTARQMIVLTRDINTKIPTAVNKSAADATQVQCVTCHRGIAVPRQIADIMADTASAKGVSAAIEQYRDMRKQYYGASSYDFSENGLVMLVLRLNAANRLDDSLAFLQLNTEFNPKSARSYLIMAQVYSRKNDKDAAIKSLEKALEIEPDNQQARRQLEQMKRP